MTLLRCAVALTAALLCSSSPSLAASDTACTELWQKTDVNSDNFLTKEEKLETFVAAAQQQKRALSDPAKLTREEFMSHCKADVFAAADATPPYTPSQETAERTPPAAPAE